MFVLLNLRDFYLWIQKFIEISATWRVRVKNFGRRLRSCEVFYPRNMWGTLDLSACRYQKKVTAARNMIRWWHRLTTLRTIAMIFLWEPPQQQQQQQLQRQRLRRVLRVRWSRVWRWLIPKQEKSISILQQWLYSYMGGSINCGTSTPKWIVYNGKSF